MNHVVTRVVVRIHVNLWITSYPLVRASVTNRVISWRKGNDAFRTQSLSKHCVSRICETLSDMSGTSTLSVPTELSYVCERHKWIWRESPSLCVSKRATVIQRLTSTRPFLDSERFLVRHPLHVARKHAIFQQDISQRFTSCVRYTKMAFP